MVRFFYSKEEAFDLFTIRTLLPKNTIVSYNGKIFYSELINFKACSTGAHSSSVYFYRINF